MVNGPGSVIFAVRVVLARRNTMSSTSTGRVRRIGPTTRGSSTATPVLDTLVAGETESRPSSALANRFE